MALSSSHVSQAAKHHLGTCAHGGGLDERVCVHDDLDTHENLSGLIARSGVHELQQAVQQVFEHVELGQQRATRTRHANTFGVDRQHIENVVQGWEPWNTPLWLRERAEEAA
jgi:hypothetical protein